MFLRWETTDLDITLRAQYETRKDLYIFHFVLALSISCSLQCSQRVGVHKSAISKCTHVPSPDLLQLLAFRLSALMAAGSGP